MNAGAHILELNTQFYKTYAFIEGSATLKRCKHKKITEIQNDTKINFKNIKIRK